MTNQRPVKTDLEYAWKVRKPLWQLQKKPSSSVKKEDMHKDKPQILSKDWKLFSSN
jgi:hypothetical protein